MEFEQKTLTNCIRSVEMDTSLEDVAIAYKNDIEIRHSYTEYGEGVMAVD